MDPEEYRADSRERWESAASGWSSRSDAFARDTAPVTAWLVDALDPQPGQTVLELTAGLGDVGLLAADRVGPTGRVLMTDGADAMVAAARERAARAGKDNVETRQMEAEWIDLAAASVDGVASRWGYMLLADPEAALRETRRVLRPGGRVALAAWDELRLNPWLGLLRVLLTERDLAPAEEPGTPGPFAFAMRGLTDDLLDAAGFVEPVTEGLDFAFHADDLDAWWDHLVATSQSLPAVLKGLSPKQHYELRDAFDAAFAPFAGDDGALTIPARTLVATASA